MSRPKKYHLQATAATKAHKKMHHLIYPTILMSSLRSLSLNIPAAEQHKNQVKQTTQVHPMVKPVAGLRF